MPVTHANEQRIKSDVLLTQCRHLFGKISPETAEEVTAGQKVKGRVAAHGVKGKGVHGTGELGHVAQLVLPVGGHCGELMELCFTSASKVTPPLGELVRLFVQSQGPEVGRGRAAAIQTPSRPTAPLLQWCGGTRGTAGGGKLQREGGHEIKSLKTNQKNPQNV